MLQTTTLEVEIGLLLLVVALVGLVSYWVYRDADARGMADAAYWGAAVGVAFVVGLIVGGLVAVAVYRSSRPEEHEGGQAPFEDLSAGDDEKQDPAHADLPPIPELTAERLESASPTALRGYARRYDDLDARADPERLRTALADLVERGEAAETLGTMQGDVAKSPDPGEADDTRRHLGRPELRTDGETATRESVESEAEADRSDQNRDESDDAEFECVEG